MFMHDIVWSKVSSSRKLIIMQLFQTVIIYRISFFPFLPRIRIYNQKLMLLNFSISLIVSQQQTYAHLTFGINFERDEGIC